MAKQMGLSVNRWAGLGRVMGDPIINGEWATIQFKTVVPELQNGSWNDLVCMVPLITNDPKKVNTIQSYIQDERQLYVEGYVNTWEGGFGVIITNIKLGSKTMYDPDAQGGGQGGGNPYPS